MNLPGTLIKQAQVRAKQLPKVSNQKNYFVSFPFSGGADLRLERFFYVNKKPSSSYEELGFLLSLSKLLIF